MVLLEHFTLEILIDFLIEFVVFVCGVPPEIDALLKPGAKYKAVLAVLGGFGCPDPKPLAPLLALLVLLERPPASLDPVEVVPLRAASVALVQAANGVGVSHF